ncbi:MAG TPA: acetylxylan esterase [Bryobacteraceae bacterium]|nr:acetylxylan esterase [Bryobacteraceae bacterium]
MTRRLFLTAAAAGALARPTLSQSVFYRDYTRCLPDYLRQLAKAAYERRNREIGKLTTAEAVRSRQRWVGETFWKLIGGMPQRTPLNARVTGRFERPGYRVEKIVYESQPGLHVSANLYIPTAGRPPYPGVLFQMGHSVNGKAAEHYQKCCQGLARLDYLVLAFDPMGQGERTYYPGPVASRTRLPGGADDEHTVPGKQMLLVGDSSVRLQAWDAVRSLDYLAAHPMVDPKRLASTGQSGGGTNTMLLAAVDDRLAAAAVSCGNTENVACADFNPPGSTDDAEQNFPGSGPLGFDRWDLLWPLAPKPLLLLPSALDFNDTYSPNYISSGREEFRKLKAAYGVMGAGERLAWQDSPLPHNLAYDSRLAIYNWFERWLKGSIREIREEPEVAPEPEETLFVSEGGSVVRAFKGETPFTLTKKRIIARQPAALDRLIGAERPAGQLGAATLATTHFRRVTIETIEIPSALQVWLPGWIYRPKAGGSKPLVVMLDPAGRAGWQEEGLYDTLASEGYAVCALDVRGIGHLGPEYPRGNPRHSGTHNTEQHYAWASLILGKPLVGQRVTDILAAVHALRARPDLASRRLVLAARGILTVPAQMAAALDSRIEMLYLAGGLVSYRNVIETEEYVGGNYAGVAPSRNDLFGGFVPNLLLHTDLPEINASLAPRRVILAGTTDAAGKTMDPAAVRRIHAGANVEVLPAAATDAVALSLAIGG